MRQFSSYGPVDKDLHFFVQRENLVRRAYAQLVGEVPEKAGHYITVWAPRQCGKTWIMREVSHRITEQGDFDVGILSMQAAKEEDTDAGILEFFASRLKDWFQKDLPEVREWKAFHRLFARSHFTRPVILILDEFDALAEGFINKFANAFRDMYLSRGFQTAPSSGDNGHALHGLALIGVRGVLGIENVTGSPFNVQRSLHIPNLTFEETESLFRWYEKESGRNVDPRVIERLFYEIRGQPGLTCWFGELLSEGFEGYAPESGSPVTTEDFSTVFAAAVDVLPNNNILNIISKARREPYKTQVLDLFRTSGKIAFKYDDPRQNFLYLNGVIDHEKVGDRYFVRFSCPFVQKRLFNYFAHELFHYTGKLHEPFEDLDDAVTETDLHIANLIRRFEGYLKTNREWLLQDAPKRKDMRIFEAVFHFALYRFLFDFLESWRARVWPEFPTGNGKVDILIEHAGKLFALEVKSYSDARAYRSALGQAARYASQLGIARISLAFFVDRIDDANREKYETEYSDEETGVVVKPVFVETDG